MRVVPVVTLALLLAGCAAPEPTSDAEPAPEDEDHPRVGLTTKVDWSAVTMPSSGALHVDLDDGLRHFSALGLRSTSTGDWGMLILEGDELQPFAALLEVEGEATSTALGGGPVSPDESGYLELLAGRLSGAQITTGAVGQEPLGGNLTAVVWGDPGSVVGWHGANLPDGPSFLWPEMPQLEDPTMVNGTNVTVTTDVESRWWVYGAMEFHLAGDNDLINIDAVAAAGPVAVTAASHAGSGLLVAQTITGAATALTTAEGMFAGTAVEGTNIERPNDDPGCLPNLVGNCIPYWGTYLAVAGPGGADDIRMQSIRADPGALSQIVAAAIRVDGLELGSWTVFGPAQEAD